MFLGKGVCCLSEGSAGLRGVAGLRAHEIHDPGGLSLCSSLQHPQGERGRPGGQWVSGVPWEWDLVSEPGVHSQPLPCLPPTTPTPPRTCSNNTMSRSFTVLSLYRLYHSATLIYLCVHRHTEIS